MNRARLALSLLLLASPVAAQNATFQTGVDASQYVPALAPLLAPRGTQWIPEPVQMFQTAIVVPFRGAGAQESLEFLFDRRGNLVEIHEAYPAGS